MKMIVKKAFLLRGERQEPGTTVDVETTLGRELLALGRAELTEPFVQEKSPMTTNTTASLVRGKAAKRSE